LNQEDNPEHRRIRQETQNNKIINEVHAEEINISNEQVEKAIRNLKTTKVWS